MSIAHPFSGGLLTAITTVYRTDNAIVGEAVDLTKEEWVGVLDLSTKWAMKKVRTGSHI